MNKTGYFTQPTCRQHEMGPGHPECAQRLDAIEDRLLITGVGDALDRREAAQASLADIELAHDRMYIASLRGLSDGLRDEIDAGGKPYCVMGCMMRVLDIGKIDKIRDGTYDTKARVPNEKVVRQVQTMADPDLTNPSNISNAWSKWALN